MSDGDLPYYVAFAAVNDGYHYVAERLDSDRNRFRIASYEPMSHEDAVVLCERLNRMVVRERGYR